MNNIPYPRRGCADVGNAGDGETVPVSSLDGHPKELVAHSVTVELVLEPEKLARILDSWE